MKKNPPNLQQQKKRKFIKTKNNFYQNILQKINGKTKIKKKNRKLKISLILKIFASLNFNK